MVHEEGWNGEGGKLYVHEFCILGFESVGLHV